MRSSTKRVGKDLTVGAIMPALLMFAAPMVLANIVQQLYGVVDLIIIGQYMGSTGTVGVSTGGEIADWYRTQYPMAPERKGWVRE